MVNTIDMQDLRHLNLFGRITRVSTRFCFKYNEAINFCVPRALVSKAIGEKGKNVREMYRILGRRVKVISQPRGIEDVKTFIESIVSPVTFKELEVKDNEVILTAGQQSKAALIGRNKRRLLEMQKIVKSFFGKEFRIV
jgi:transcription antitermination factor NusA-like protein